MGVGWQLADDLDALPDTDRRPELLDGVLLVPPSPSDAHQLLAGLLMTTLHRTRPREYAVTQGVEVRLSPRRSFIPDVLVITTTARERRTNWFSPHEVVVAVEIVSPSTISIDRITKPALYAQAGIPYYWRVETNPDLVVHTYKIDPLAEVYRETGAFSEAIDVTEPWPVRIPLSDLVD